MKHTTFQFEFRDLQLNVDQIERIMGYPEGESHETIRSFIEDALEKAAEVCELKAEFVVYEEILPDEKDKTITIDNTLLSIGKIIFGQIRKADSAALFRCTAGAGIGEISRNAMKNGDPFEGYLYDVIGSEVVESVAELMQNELEKQAEESQKHITNRFSPGYCGWNVSEQHKLFSLMPENYCGIVLTGSALMQPIKSVSGIIGIGQSVKRMPYTCKICDMKDCIYRKRQ